MAFKLTESAMPGRWCGNAPHMVALVRARTTFVKQVERRKDQSPSQAESTLHHERGGRRRSRLKILIRRS
jgi:hypothetical protein